MAEIQFLKTRLESLENRIRQKEQLKDRIIQRRIETLMQSLSSDAEAAKTQNPSDGGADNVIRN